MKILSQKTLADRATQTRIPPPRNKQVAPLTTSPQHSKDQSLYPGPVCFQVHRRGEASSLLHSLSRPTSQPAQQPLPQKLRTVLEVPGEIALARQIALQLINSLLTKCLHHRITADQLTV